MTEEQRNARIYGILYSTDSREELAVRMVELEELCEELWRDLKVHGYKVETILNARYERRMRELGSELAHG